MAHSTFAPGAADIHVSLLDLLPVLIIALVLSNVGFTGGFDEATLKTLDEPEKKKTNKSFGWLEADMRVPLPTLDELRDGCHLIGHRGGKHMYLCAQPVPVGGMAVKECELSADFSDYYNAQVHVCEGETYAPR